MRNWIQSDAIDSFVAIVSDVDVCQKQNAAAAAKTCRMCRCMRMYENIQKYIQKNWQKRRHLPAEKSTVDCRLSDTGTVTAPLSRRRSAAGECTNGSQTSSTEAPVARPAREDGTSRCGGRETYGIKATYIQPAVLKSCRLTRAHRMGSCATAPLTKERLKE